MEQNWIYISNLNPKSEKKKEPKRTHSSQQQYPKTHHSVLSEVKHTIIPNYGRIGLIYYPSIGMETLRITQNGKTSQYIAYCQRFLTTTPASQINLTATGRAVTKAIIVAEVIKTNIEGMRSSASVSELEMQGRWVSSLTLLLNRHTTTETKETPKRKKRKLSSAEA